MTPEKWERIKQLFESASRLEPAQRHGFLADVCAGDEEMLGEVESLLAAYKDAGDFIESPPAEALQVAAGLDTSLPYERLGPYRLLRRVGFGGMGSVYLAERDDKEFHQRAAIKVVSRGMNTDFILRRFRLERQILAGLNHPNITMLLDGGVTPDGLPYFVMEYVDGLPILAYCENRDLTLRQRLDLFRTVCAAVQHAHKNRVVHRDLKPSNILVTADGTPKLLDFGIAKVFEPGSENEVVEQTMSTRSLMTPDYASPEQVRGEPATPASDIYSLGVLLYEMLTRQRPYRVDTPTPRKIAEAVCAQQPERPSTVATRSREDTAGRAPELGWVRKLRGDLDEIVLMTLRKEPEQRYASVEELSEDIRRHLEELPVRARRGARTYRAGKFLHRHRMVLLAAGLAALLLLGGSVAVMRWAGPGSNRLSTGGRPSTNPEANEYFEKAQMTGQANWDPPRIIQLLAKALEKDPGFAAARADYGFYHLVMVDGGISEDEMWLNKAEYELNRAVRDDPASSKTYAYLAAVSYYRRRAEDVLKFAAEAERLSPGDPESRIWLLNEFNLMGDYAAAERLAREILRRDPFYFPARMNLASLLLEEGDLAGSIRESEKVLEQNPNITNCIRTLAVTYLEAGRPDKARAILSRARPADRGNFQLRLAWAVLLATEGRSLEARLELDDSTRRWAGIVPFTVIWVAEIYSVLGNTDSGIEWLQKAIRIGDRRLAWFRRNPHLAFIRRDQRFERLLASAIPTKP